MHAVLPASLKTNEKLKENIVKPKRGKRITGKQKIAVDTA